MFENIKIALLGGDARQISLALRLAEAGYRLSGFGLNGNIPDSVSVADGYLSALHGSSAVILPLPASYDGVNLNVMYETPPTALSDIIENAPRGALIFGGKLNLPDDVSKAAVSDGKRLVDYYTEEEVIIRNALPSAEGAVSLAMNLLDKTICNSNIAVVGYGRLGYMLSQILSSLGANVTVAARNPGDLARIKNNRYTPLDISVPGSKNALPSLAVGYDVIFNTVPHRIFDADILSYFSPSMLLIDLASPPGGFCTDNDLITDKLSETVTKSDSAPLKIHRAQSIPGKYAPVTAGNIIADFVLAKLKQEGIMPL